MTHVSIPEKFALFTEQGRPKVVARLNGQEVKLIRVQGVFPWHLHENEDEMFLVCAVSSGWNPGPHGVARPRRTHRSARWRGAPHSRR